jgi:ABC-type antimicrobial peptide transport system permease subunit
VFYIRWGVYGASIVAVCVIVVVAMMFSASSVRRVEIADELKLGSL